jgi:hypothetical protein
MIFLLLEGFLSLPAFIAIYVMSRSITWGAVAGLFIVFMLLAWVIFTAITLQ